MDQKSMGIVIARQRKEKGFTQKQLGDKLSVSNKTVSKWETGEGFPDITILPVLAEALDITVDELLDGSSLKNNENLKRDDMECTEYLMDKTILKFKNSCILSVAFSIFGVMAYWILWYETHNRVSLLISLVFGLASGCVGLIGYNALQMQMKKFNKLFPNRKKSLYEMRKYLEKLIYVWMIYVWVAIDFTIVNCYGNYHETIRAFIGGLAYGSICLYLNSKLKMKVRI
ncbi:helix-turn-helix domain-containing protein [Clostridium cadaveris]|uniref:helix-turn-helix domain-containing protein n=1 Tax=Clostridium cadaveris TaxID=1529 RepID=UPI00040AC03C|nr:helix-turn-helix transcriptional regulator [Clostridium cadaveris]MDY4948179.1 helix-turn-helix transcriptional regulator [Clostridium cadaveris]NME65235.1 helix-turn-helix transcriptional regulator [Clostridium cadaveris]